MHHVDLNGLRVAVLTADGGEQVEITSPVEALRDHNAEVEIVSVKRGKLRTVNFLYPGKKLRIDRSLQTAAPEDYDALVIPGGLIGPDTLRQSDEALDFVRGFDRAGKPIAVICHGPWLLASAGLLVRRNLTSWPGIKDDVRNAGGIWHDEPMVRDRNWVSSRGPQDLDEFNRGMLELFGERAAVAPPRPEYSEKRPRRRREGGLPIGKMLAGGLLAAGIAYLIREMKSEEEYVEVVDLAPAPPAPPVRPVRPAVVEVDVVEAAPLRPVVADAGLAHGTDASGPEYVGTDVRAGTGGTGPAGYGGTGYNPPAV